MEAKDSLGALLEGYDEGKAQKAFERHKKEVEDTSKEAVATQVPSSMGACLDAGSDLLKLVAEDRKGLLAFPRLTDAVLDSLASWRLALWYAVLNVVMSLPSSRRERLLLAATELRTKRKQLFAAVDLIWPEDTQMQTRLAELRKGSGYADLADDGQALVALFRQHANAAKEWLEPTKLNGLIADCDKLSQLMLDLRREPEEETERIQAELLRNRIYTRYQQVYDEIARAGRYLHEGVNAAKTEAYAPLYTSYLRRIRSEKGPSKAEESPSTTPNPSPEPTPTPASS